MTVWPRNGDDKKKADDLIDFMRSKKLITKTKLKELKLVYRAVTIATHVAELIFEFEADHEIFEESDQE